MNFKVGDTVRFKSGGPLMTVIQLEGDKVRCQWFDDNKPVAQLFVAAALEADDDEIHVG